MFLQFVHIVTVITIKKYKANINNEFKIDMGPQTITNTSLSIDIQRKEILKF